MHILDKQAEQILKGKILSALHKLAKITLEGKYLSLFEFRNLIPEDVLLEFVHLNFDEILYSSEGDNLEVAISF